MKRLTLEQLVMLERLTEQQHTVTGQRRKRDRSRLQDQALGIPREHQLWMAQRTVRRIGSSKLLDLLNYLYDQELERALR
jgi:predicted nucleotidyltransferase